MSKSRGLGAILTDNDTKLEFQPNMADLGTQYVKNLNENWPNKSKTIGLIIGNSLSTGDGIRIYGRTKNSYQYLTSSINSLSSIVGVPDIAASDGANYIAIGGSDTSATTLELYKRTGTTFTKLTGPATMPTDTCSGLTISSDGTYIAYTQLAAPYLYIFKRTGDTFTNLSNPGTMPTGAGRTTKFSFDDNYLAVGHTTSPYLTVYSRSGDTFTKLSNPATLPSDLSLDILAWSGNSYLTVIGGSSTIELFKVSGSTISKLSNPATQPVVGTIADIAGSSDSNYVVTIGGTSPFFAAFKINTSTDVITKLSLSGVAVSFGSTTGTTVTISKDSKYVCVGYGTNIPYAAVYTINSNDTFTKLTEQFSGDGLTAAPQSIQFINAS